jgi:lipopolysaccharide transport system ATP-binding protein
MSQPIIEVKDLSKLYRIGTKESYYSLRDSISQAFSPRRKKKTPAGEFWALRDLNFEVAPGESIGVIGRNGAGKSTLLKVLSQITPPTTGKISIRGRVASLLEVGTGFHPELTGRENIYLNGAILGMTRQEIRSKFDEIVAFSGIEKFLETPVKRYSSGMYVRLAFAVAAHLEPEILIVDEVLAVGDAEFQKKSVGKMESVTREEGRTILFVSHNLLTVQELCTRSILLENGRVKMIGKTADVIDTYLNNTSVESAGPAKAVSLNERENAGEIRFTGVTIANGKGSGTILSHDKLRIIMDYTSDLQRPIDDVRVVLTVTSELSQQVVLRLDSDIPSNSIGRIQPKGQIVCETDAINLSEGQYAVDINFHIQGTSVDSVKRATTFDVHTDINSYGFKVFPDKTVCDHVIKYTFKQ